MRLPKNKISLLPVYSSWREGSSGKHPNWQLYLWKEHDDFLGIIGIELGEHTFIVHHAAVIPSYRNEGIGHKMVEEIQRLQEHLAMCSSPQTKEFLEKCWDSFYPI